MILAATFIVSSIRSLETGFTGLGSSSYDELGSTIIVSPNWNVTCFRFLNALPLAVRNALGKLVLGIAGSVKARFACGKVIRSCGRDEPDRASSKGRYVGVKRPWKSVVSSSLVPGDLPALFLGGVPERFAGDRDSDLVRGGLPTSGGVVVPFIVSFSTLTVGWLGSAAGLDLEFEELSDGFFPLTRPFARTCLPAKRLDRAEIAGVLLVAPVSSGWDRSFLLPDRNSCSKLRNSLSFWALKLAISSPICLRFSSSSAAMSDSESLDSSLPGEGSDERATFMCAECRYIADGAIVGSRSGWKKSAYALIGGQAGPLNTRELWDPHSAACYPKARHQKGAWRCSHPTVAKGLPPVTQMALGELGGEEGGRAW